MVHTNMCVVGEQGGVVRRRGCCGGSGGCGDLGAGGGVLAQGGLRGVLERPREGVVKLKL